MSMSRLALDDKAVSDRMSKERFENAKEAFAAGNILQTGQETDVDMDTSWVYSLTKDASGRFEKSINNAVIILHNDPLLEGGMPASTGTWTPYMA